MQNLDALLLLPVLVAPIF